MKIIKNGQGISVKTSSIQYFGSLLCFLNQGKDLTSQLLLQSELFYFFLLCGKHFFIIFMLFCDYSTLASASLSIWLKKKKNPDSLQFRFQI